MQAPILIVDDEANIRTTLRGILQDEGYPTLEAESGDGVLDLIAACRPRLVVLDVWMPHVDGIALLERLQTEHPELPVIVISGHGTIETAVRATKLGAADFIEKPFSLETMLHSVQRALGSERAAVSHGRPRAESDSAARPTSDATPGCRARTIGKSVVLHGRPALLHPSAQHQAVLGAIRPALTALPFEAQLEVRAEREARTHTAAVRTALGQGQAAVRSPPRTPPSRGPSRRPAARPGTGLSMRRRWWWRLRFRFRWFR